jgi:putative copper resistance protein D
MLKHAAIVCAMALWLCGAVSAQWGSGWTIPAGAEKETNPVKPGSDTIKKGKSLFDTSCARCHGPEGRGDGKDSDASAPAADLTDPFRAELNPDGVIFHRIAAGKPPVMPAFKSQMTPEQIWTVVHYVKSLRTSP